MEDFIKDDSMFLSNDYKTFESFVKTREENSEWQTASLKNVRFMPNKDPLERQVYATQIGCSLEALFDADVLMSINGRVLPIRECSIKSVLDRTGLGNKGFKVLKSKDISKLTLVLNELVKAQENLIGEGTVVRIADEKANAMLSCLYKPVSVVSVMETVADYIDKNFNAAKFQEGFFSHEMVSCVFDLEKYKTSLFPKNLGIDLAGFEPALRIYTSDIGESSVTVEPLLLRGKTAIPLNYSLKIPHTVDNAIEKLKENLEMVFQHFTKVLKNLSDLKKITIQNPHPAMLRLAKKVGLPKRQVYEVIEQFDAMEGNGVSDAYTCYIYLTEVLFLVERDFKGDKVKQLRAADSMNRCLACHWNNYDIAGEFSW